MANYERGVKQVRNKIINANIRTQNLKANRLRRQGYIPGVVYGKETQATPIMIENKSLNRLLREAGHNVFFELAMEDEVKPVRLREIQRDPVTKDIIHIDAQVINRNEKIKAKVPIKLEGAFDVEKRAVALQRQKDFVEVEGLAEHIPSHINVLVRGLKQGDSIRVADLEISEELSIIDNTEEIVLSIVRNSRLDLDQESKIQENTTSEIQRDEDENGKAEEAHNQESKE